MAGILGCNRVSSPKLRHEFLVSRHGSQAVGSC